MTARLKSEENLSGGSIAGAVARSGAVKQVVLLNFIQVGTRLASCTMEEADQLISSDQARHKTEEIAVTASGRLLKGRKVVAACKLKGLTVVEVFVLPDSRALDSLFGVCDKLAGQLTPLQVALQCKKGYEHYVEFFPETRRGRWAREKRSDCAFHPPYAAIIAETLGRSVRWAQESIKIGREIAEDVANVLLSSEPDAGRSSLQKLSQLPAELQRRVAETVRKGEMKLEEALRKLDQSVVDEGAKYARAVNRLLNLLARLDGLGEYLDHPSVLAARSRYQGNLGFFMPILAALPDQLGAAELISLDRKPEDASGVPEGSSVSRAENDVQKAA
ncbi:MAG TPA: hypothetical protein VGC89_02200 [Pyrinomonadaceae bacterium]